MGTIVHGLAYVVHIVPPQVQSNSNLVCYCLDRALMLARDKLAAGKKSVPADFWLQVDGCSANWSSTVMAHCAYMAQHGARQTARAAARRSARRAKRESGRGARVASRRLARARARVVVVT